MDPASIALALARNWRVCLIAALVAFGGVQTYRIDRLKAAPVKERVKTVEKIVYRQAKAAEITEDVGRKSAEREAGVRTITRTLIEKVPVYVTAEADRNAVVPVGFVRLHDAAAAGTPAVPFGAGESADTPSGLALSAVASTVTDNYGQCLAWRSQVIGWQDWYAQQKAAWNNSD